MNIEIKYLQKIVEGEVTLILAYLLVVMCLLVAISTEDQGLMIMTICFSVAMFLISIVSFSQAGRIRKKLKGVN